MAKYTNIGYVAIPKAQGKETEQQEKTRLKKRYIKISKGTTLTVRNSKGDEVTIHGDDAKKSFISMLEPRPFPGQSEEDFAQQQKWKRFDLVIVTD